MSALDFSRRSGAAEWMDDDAVDYGTLRACLVDLAKANRWTLAYLPTLAFLNGLNRRGLWPKDRPLRLIDVGSGYGDLIRTVDRWAARRGLAIDLTGIDLSPWSERAAAEATPPGRPISWVTADVFEDARPADVITSSLFTHHLSDAMIVRFLRTMETRVRIGWFINDLHRHPLPYIGFKALSKAMGWHPFVQHDGPVSIARAFTKADWSELIAQAGLSPQAVRVAWRFPFRLCVSRLKP
jgi:2-polyprenyl-3-methyl-5-hydroxy-6-metoxy-1,4-benzoquinol methylase